MYRRSEGGVHYSPFQEGQVLFGAWVEIECQSGVKGKKIRFRIVGADEIINTKDYISMDSTMALALMKKGVGDEAVVQTGTNTFVWCVTIIN